MTNEAARHLMELPKYTAYAKAHKRAKITMRRLPEKNEMVHRPSIEFATLMRYERRSEIERKTKERREKWKEVEVVAEDSEPPAPYGHTQEEGSAADSPKAPVVERDGPPPVSHR